MDAPTATELLNDPTVKEALEEAWADSMPDDSQQRHEEGGWIYLDPGTGKITVRRTMAGTQALLDLSNPPIIAGSVVVGKFHTHPNPSADGWESGPSADDLQVDRFHGVPDLIRADDGVHFSGPDQRRGGLLGGPGYPA